jgi:preprotein translocase subunit SecA
VGTTSVEKSEILHRLLKHAKIEHEVLNAKHHTREALIVAQAGRSGRVTVATNMAGRGTDIILGGNAEHWGQALLEEQDIARRYTPNWEYVEDFVKAICINKEDEARELRAKHDVLAEISDETIAQIAERRDKFKGEQADVLEAGGLFILGTERHESRRIDNQLRGRAGRQGDPGESRFFLSLEDDLMRIFAKDNLVKIMDWAGMDDSAPIESKYVSRSVETAQRRIEGQHFDHRKNLLEYDDVMNQQRQTLYKFRLDILKANPEQLQEICLDSIENIVTNLVDTHCN